MSLLPIAPGQAPEFKLTPVPANIPTTIQQIGWACQCSDGSPVTMIANSSDATGMTATLTIPETTKPGSMITMWCTYRNSDPQQTEVLGGPWKLTVVAAPVVS